jgi:hypothetical protein
MTLVTVVVVNYNGGELVLRCLDSIYADVAGLEVEAIVVDNASTDGSLEKITGRFPQATIIRNAENAGFARANNQAFLVARGEIVILLNNDAYFMPGALPQLIALMGRHAEAAMVGPRILNPDGSVQRSWFRFPTFIDVVAESFFLRKILGRPDPLGQLPEQGQSGDTLVQVDWILGACMVVRRAAIDAAGPLDERYFMYSEELDWCKAMWEAGIPTYYWPVATVVHFGQQGRESRRIRPEILATGFERKYDYFRKHHGADYARAVKAVSVAGIALRLCAVAPFVWLGGSEELRRSMQAYRAVLRASLSGRKGAT